MFTAPAPAAFAPGVAPVIVLSATASLLGVPSDTNPSPDLKLLVLLMPSIVMLIVVCGRPMIVDPRGPASVSTPGRKTVKYSALLDTSGRLLICSVVIVDVTVEDCVCTSSVAALTSTVSV